MKKVGYFFYTFVPLLAVEAIQTIALFFMMGMGVFGQGFVGKLAFPSANVSDRLEKTFTSVNFNMMIMVIYALITIAIFGMWYYARYEGNFLPSPKKTFNPMMLVAIVILVPHVQNVKDPLPPHNQLLLAYNERSTISMNITYTQNGDYLIPNIVIRKTKPIGHYGRLRKAYLEMHRPILFNELVLSDKLFEHCAEIEEAARNRMELIVRSLAEQNGVTEQLKAENQMEWVRQMNACKAQAEEVVKAELIYN